MVAGQKVKMSYISNNASHKLGRSRDRDISPNFIIGQKTVGNMSFCDKGVNNVETMREMDAPADVVNTIT